MKARAHALPVLCVAFAASSALAQAYVDRVLDDGPQPRLRLERDVDTTGWARGWRVEASEVVDHGDQRSRAHGLGLSGFIDTPNHGTISASANVSAASGRPSATLWRIDQVGLPLDGGWRADHGVGDLVSPVLSLARGIGRIGLPSNPLEGATAVYSRGAETRLVAATGRPGVYSGLNINGFETGRGQLAFAGGQRNWLSNGGESSLAIEYAGGHGLANTLAAGGTESADSLWSAWRWRGRSPWAGAESAEPVLVYGPRLRDGDLEVQVNSLGTRRSTSPTVDAASSGGSSAVGAWTDARWRTGILEQGAGVFHLPAGLRWGSYPAVADLRGGYWNADLTQRQWQLGTNVEWTESASGAGVASTLVTTTARRRFDTRNSLSGVVSVRERGAAARSAQLAWDNRNTFGQTQWRTEILRASTRQADRIGVDHALLFESGTSLAASLSAERNEELGLLTRLFGWGVVGSVRPASGLTFDAALRGTQGSNGMRQLNGNVGLGWTLNARWSLLAQYAVNRGEDPQTLLLLSPLVPAVQASTSSRYERFQVTLRYEERAGQSVAPVGGAPGSAAGRLAGTVFFDADRNGRRDASESGAPEVSIRLDGRYLVRTDNQGRFEFPFVVAGTHTLEVVADNVPLPWSLADARPQRVEVAVRALSTVEFALVRDP